jgi:cytohesin
VNLPRALQDAIQNGDLEKAKSLLGDHPELVLTKDERGRTPLHLAAERGDEDIAQLLLGCGADAGARDGLGATPLHVAATAGHTAVAGSLVASKSDVNAKDKGGNGPLHLAARLGRHDAVAFLLACKAKVDARNFDGETPLHRAATAGHKVVVELLLRSGADITAEDFEGRTALQLAERMAREDVVELLLPKGVRVHEAVKKRDLEKMKALLEDDNSLVSFRDSSVLRGATPLHLAVYEGFEEAAELLLAKGSDVNAKAGDGATPLCWAARNGHRRMIEFLLAKGADVNAFPPGGLTPLYFAASRGERSTVELLLSKGANVNCGYSRPLQAAIINGHKDVAELLRQRGGSRSFSDLSSDEGPIGKTGNRIMDWVVSAAAIGMIMFLMRACELHKR